jgi:hypothetical protein
MGYGQLQRELGTIVEENRDQLDEDDPVVLLDVADDLDRDDLDRDDLDNRLVLKNEKRV